MIWPWIALGILGAPVTLILHELSHVVFVKLSGGEVTVFKPWPHRFEGRFVFGRVWAIWEDGRSEIYRWSHIAPLLKAIVLLSVWNTLSYSHYRPMLILGAWELTDVAKWIWNYFGKDPETDARKWRDR